MRQVTIFSFLFLTVIISGLLFWQWSVFSTQQEQLYLEENVRQQLSIEVSADKITVNQVYYGLEAEKNYELNIPDSITEWECSDANIENCVSDEGINLVSSPTDEIKLTYSFPIDRTKNSMLLKNWSITIKDLKVKSTKVEIAEKSKRDTYWVAGGKFVGMEQLQLIDYFVYESNKESVPLYWENDQFNKKSLKNNINLYSAQEIAEFDFGTSFLNEVNNEPVSIIITNKINAINENGLVIVDEDTTIEQIERQMAYQYFIQLSEGEISPAIYDLFSSLALKEKPQTEKGKSMLKSMKDNLADFQIEHIINSVVNKEIKFTTKKLDDEIAKIKGLRTDFFTLNNENETTFTMYFYEPKTVFVNNIESNIKVVVENNKRYFPFIETMEQLNFEVNHLSDQILLTRDYSTLRFYLDKNIFIYDEEDFGLLESPLVEMNGAIYIEQKWLINILKISIEEIEDTIRLTD